MTAGMAELDLNALLALALAAGRAGGEIVGAAFGNPREVQSKAPGDWVSATDTASERAVRAVLTDGAPSIPVFGEEEGGERAELGWLVDPLDGTTNFLHGLPHWAVSIALEREGEIVAGVVYEPVRDEMFWAEKGQGCFLNSARLRVSERRRLDDSLIATGIPFKGRGDHPAFLREQTAVMAEVAGIRRFGSAALDLAYVAAGRYEGFWETGLSPWDVAAGILLVSEAGGFVTEIGGGRNPLYGPTLLAANSHLHRPLSKLLVAANAKKAAEAPGPGPAAVSS